MSVDGREGPPPAASGTLEPEPQESAGPSTGRVLATASLILTVAALASRLLGWVRLLVIGSQFGASRELDAYFAAFRIPDAIFQLVVAGALSAALIPVFSSYRARQQEAEAWRLASSVINLVVIALAALSLVMAIFAPLLVPIVAPGFDAPTTELTVRLTRIMLLSPVLDRDGGGGQRHPELLRALRRAQPGAAGLQPGDHRRRHLPGADDRGRGAGGRRGRSARWRIWPSSCRSCAG